MVEEIDRKIYFYQIVWVTSDNSRIRKSKDFLDSILSQNTRLTTIDPTVDILLENFDTLVPSKPATTSLWKLSKIRKSDLPLKFNETNMRTSPLNLQLDEGLYNPTHFIIFNGSIIGAEINHSGPYISSGLPRILNDHIARSPIDGIKRVEIHAIMRENVFELIDSLEEIRGISIQIATDYARLLKSEDITSFGKMFSAADLVDNLYINLAFKIGHKKAHQPQPFKKVTTLIKKILQRPDSKDNVNILNVWGRKNYSDEIEKFNLLEELLIAERKVTKIDQVSRGVDSIDMFSKILQSKTTYEQELAGYVPVIT
jgi:hypothetical protein